MKNSRTGGGNRVMHEVRLLKKDGRVSRPQKKPGCAVPLDYFGRVSASLYAIRLGVCRPIAYSTPSPDLLELEKSHGLMRDLPALLLHKMPRAFEHQRITATPNDSL